MESQTAQQTPQPEVQETPKPSGSKTRIVILIVILVIVVVAGVGFFLLINKGQEETGPKVITGLDIESITIAQPPAFSGIFPDSVPDFAEVVFNNNIFDGLGRIVDGEVKPALAISWTNPDNTTWRFTLRKGVKFHNGDFFTAADVKFSIDQALKNGWPNAFNLSTVKSVEVVDDFTVSIKTTSPDPVLLNRLVFAFIVSEKQFKEKEKSAEAVGTGPYKFVSLDKDQAVLSMNENYYLGTPKVKKIVYKFFPSDVTDKELIEALKKGDVDLAKVSDEKLSQTAGLGFQTKNLTTPFISFLWMDVARDKSPYVDKTPNPLKNKLVRQAIYKAINVSSVIKESKISAVPASQFVTNAIFGFNPNIARPEPNIEEAKQLMKKAGYEDGFDLTLDVRSFESEVGESIAKQLKNININVKVNIAGRDEAFKKWFDDQDVSAYIIDYGAETYDSGEIFTDILHSVEGNFGAVNYLTLGYSNPEINKLAEEIASIFDTKTRASKLQEAMTKAVDEVPFIPLYSLEAYYIFGNDINWTPTAFGAIYANEISGREVIT